MSNITTELYEKRKVEIGQRIREERRKQNLTQDEFKDKIFISSRQTIARWESGRVLPSMADFLAMCILFDCDMGYLLCEHDCKTRTATDIQAETGLSESAIVNLQEAHKKHMFFVLLAIDKLLNDNALYSLDIIGRYLSIGDNITIERIDGQQIKEKTLLALDVQQSIDEIRRTVQTEIKEGKTLVEG